MRCSVERQIVWRATIGDWDVQDGSWSILFMLMYGVRMSLSLSLHEVDVVSSKNVGISFFQYIYGDIRLLPADPTLVAVPLI